VAFEIRDYAFSLHANVGDTTASFEIANTDQSSSTTHYFGYVSIDGRYFVQKRETASRISDYTYAYGTSAYSTAWTNRASLTYYAFDALEAAVT
jgi:hypothetical protein